MPRTSPYMLILRFMLCFASICFLILIHRRSHCLKYFLLCYLYCFHRSANLLNTSLCFLTVAMVRLHPSSIMKFLQSELVPENNVVPLSTTSNMLTWLSVTLLIATILISLFFIKDKEKIIHRRLLPAHRTGCLFCGRRSLHARTRTTG